MWPVDKPDKVQLLEAMFGPLLLARVLVPAAAATEQGRVAALPRQAGQAPGGQHSTPAGHSVKGCSPTVPEEEKQSRCGDSDQGWPTLVTARPPVGAKSPTQSTRPGTSVPTAKSIMSLPAHRLSLFYPSKQLVITFIAVTCFKHRFPYLLRPRDPVRNSSLSWCGLLASRSLRILV